MDFFALGFALFWHGFPCLWLCCIVAWVSLPLVLLCCGLGFFAFGFVVSGLHQKRKKKVQLPILVQPILFFIIVKHELSLMKQGKNPDTTFTKQVTSLTSQNTTS